MVSFSSTYLTELERQRKLDDRFDRKEMDVREWLEFGLRDEPEGMSIPILSSAEINEELTWVIKYHGTQEVERPGFTNPQSIFLFPLIPSVHVEAVIEYMRPSEWRVFFIGKVSELLESIHGKTFDKLKASKRDDQIVVLQCVNREMIGLWGEEMGSKYYICGFAHRVIVGSITSKSTEGLSGTGSWVVSPKTYIQNF